MGLKYYIDKIDITDLVASSFSTSEQRSIAGQDRINISSFSMQVWNDGDAFSYFNPASIFYGRNEWEAVFEVWQDDITKIYEGKVGKVTSNPVTNIATIEVNSILNDMVNRSVVYVGDNLTPADAFYEIMQLYGLEDYVNLYTYRYSKAYQEDIGLYVDVYFALTSSTTLTQAMQKLANISGCDCYFSNGEICFEQWQPIDADIEFGFELNNYDIVGNVEFWNDNQNIYNQYSYTITIASSDFSFQDYYIGADSRQLWGERSYSNINLASTQDISSTALIALRDAGSLKIQRTQSPKRYCKFSIDTVNFNYPFDLLTHFQFADNCIDALGGGIENTRWRVTQLNIGNLKVDIVAVQI